MLLFFLYSRVRFSVYRLFWHDLPYLGHNTVRNEITNDGSWQPRKVDVWVRCRFKEIVEEKGSVTVASFWKSIASCAESKLNNQDIDHAKGLKDHGNSRLHNPRYFICLLVRYYWESSLGIRLLTVAVVFSALFVIVLWWRERFVETNQLAYI